MKPSSSGEGSLNRSKFKKPLDSTKVDIYKEEMLKNKVNTLSETYIFGVPTVYKIVENKFADLYLGTESCAKLFSSLK